MSNASSFSQYLLSNARPYIDAQVAKPFLQGMIHGNLPVDCFEFWLKVDYPYLFNFIKVMAVGLSKAQEPQDMWVFLEHIKGIQNEMLDHEGHAARIGLDKAELLRYKPSPLKYTYMTHQLTSAYQGNAAETIAGALACQWGYGECCRTLLKRYGMREDNQYKKWFEFHASEIHLPSLQMSLDLVDRHAASGTPAQRDRIEQIFMTSVQLETMLWDEYYNKTEWERH